MNDRDIKQLSASKLPNELDHFYFVYRVHNTKYFTSVDEVLEWLDKILLNKSKPLNPDYSDTLGPTIPATDDILRINILDECICSLCSELFRQYYRKDFDFIADIVEKLRQFIYTCTEYHDYFIHPIAVATTLSNMKLDDETICAGLMHDVLEDTEVSYDEMKEMFGEEITFLVDGVTKLKNLNYSSREEKQAEIYLLTKVTS